MKNERMYSTTVYMTTQQIALLRAMSDKTRVPISQYVRQGVDLVLKKYGEKK